MSKANSVFLILLFNCLAACNSEREVEQRMGRPDLIFESAGDLGRWYFPGDAEAVKYPWRWSEKELLYMERGVKVRITKDGFETATTLTLDDNDRKVFADMKSWRRE